jgi:hypothetical protein
VPAPTDTNFNTLSWQKYFDGIYPPFLNEADIRFTFNGWTNTALQWIGYPSGTISGETSISPVLSANLTSNYLGLAVAAMTHAIPSPYGLSIGSAYVSTCLNPDLIAIDQDPLLAQTVIVSNWTTGTGSNCMIFKQALAPAGSGSFAIFLLNSDTTNVLFTLNATNLGLSANGLYSIKDSVWQTNVGAIQSVPSAGVFGSAITYSAQPQAISVLRFNFSQPGQYQSGSSIYLMPSNYDSMTFVDSAQTRPYTYAMGDDAGPITNVNGTYEINKQFNSLMGGQTIWGLQLGPITRAQPGQRDVIVVRQDGRTYWNMNETAAFSYFSVEGGAVMYWNANGDLYSLGNGTATFGAFALTGASGGISSAGVFSGNGSGLTNTFSPVSGQTNLTINGTGVTNYVSRYGEALVTLSSGTYWESNQFGQAIYTNSTAGTVSLPIAPGGVIHAASGLTGTVMFP